MLNIISDLLEIYSKASFHFQKINNNKIVQDILLQRQICNLYRSGHFSINTKIPLLFQFLALNNQIIKLLNHKPRNLVNDIDQINRRIIEKLKQLDEENSKK